MYLDNAATSYPKPEAVYETVLRTMREVGASPGRGGYGRALEAGRLLFQARESVADFFAIADSSRIIFTGNATGALNLALHGTLRPGDHVVTTSMEHNSLLRPLYALRNAGVELTIVKAAADGVVAPEQIRQALRKNSVMVAVSHVSNVCGAIQPLAEISRICRTAGVRLLVDAAQSAGHLPLSVAELAIDLLAVPGHKGLLGPSGTGFLYAAPHLQLRPLQQGGTGTNSTAEEQPLMMPDGFEAGTHNTPGIAGLQAGLEFLTASGVAALHLHETALLQQAEDALRTIDGLAVHGPRSAAERCAVLSFTIAGIDAGELAGELDRDYDIAVRAGLHCAPLAHRTLGTAPGGTVRISPGFSTTREEIAIFADAVVQCAKKLRS